MKQLKKKLIYIAIGLTFAPSALALETPVSQLGQLPQGRVGLGSFKCQLAEAQHNQGTSPVKKETPVQANKGNKAINGGG